MQRSWGVVGGRFGALGLVCLRACHSLARACLCRAALRQRVDLLILTRSTSIVELYAL